MANAIKYATAFPVIILSAMQGVAGDVFEEVEREAAKKLWISRNNLFRLWYVSSLILTNASYRKTDL
jgi:hypothetical protein